MDKYFSKQTFLVMFIVAILTIFVVKTIFITKKAVTSQMASSVSPVKKMCNNYSADILLNNVEIRSKYLAEKTKNINFFVYSVRRSDNLWKIAKRYGYSVDTLIGNNPQLKTYRVNVSQKILVPSIGGSLHPIQRDDTWLKIAKRYGADAKTLRNTNLGVVKLIPGEYVFIPGKKPDINLMNKAMQEKYELRSLFVYPLIKKGRLSSKFGHRIHPITGKMSLHAGIDISVPVGTCVAAAAGGEVIVASYNMGHYGTAVFIDHKNGYVTHYGHLSSIRVKVGQKVKAKQYIAKSGATGRVTGPHLHFTVKKRGKALDPLKFLW
ncbi:MAG: M23 family metallopeptidase [Endomicrobium sp.]|jgi:murein DD-endopeptidase MepM/ murein hydrolase activator NlpD|nr:M23 family metallopeptidase [Endomicrobium sp.]